jgi:GntR family transcriptional regulator
MDNKTLSRDSSVPLYQQLKQRLIKEIESGAMMPHMRLPSERELVQSLGVSRITIRQALSELVQQGLLYTTPSKGFYVAERKPSYQLNALMSFTSLALERGQHPSSRVLESGIKPATAALAQQLLVSPGTDLVSLVRVRMLDGVPVMLVRSWLPHSSCPGLLDFDLASGSLFKILTVHYHHNLARAYITISGRLATSQEHKLLDMGDCTVVVTMEAITFTGEEFPIEYSTTLFHPERYPLNLVQGGSGAAIVSSNARRSS